CRMLVPLVDVTPGGVRLPHLDELIAHRSAIAVEHSPGHHDPFAQRLARVLNREVALNSVHISMPEGGRNKLDGFGVGVVQIFRRMPQDAAAVRRGREKWAVVYGGAR